MHCAPLPTYANGTPEICVTKLFSHALLFPWSALNATSPLTMVDSSFIFLLMLTIASSFANPSTKR